MQYLRTIEVSIEEFYKEVRESQADAVGDPYLSTFIDCLLASADYESFYKVMAREGGKSAARKVAASIATVAESKAESKTSSSRYDAAGGGKKGGDDDDGDDFDNEDVAMDADYKSTRK